MSAVEFLIFSDFHAHNFKYGAKRVSVPAQMGLYNSRLADSLRVLTEMRMYAHRHGIECVLFGGDLFHRRSAVSTDVFNLVLESLSYFETDGIELHLLVGNHDMADRLGHVHSLEAFDFLPNVFIHDSVNLVPTLGFDMVTVPYTDDVNEARRRLQRAGELVYDPDNTILLAHLGMQGAKVGSDYVLISDGDIVTKDVPNERFAGCFFGHFHEHQQLFSNGWFIGASHQHNWGDSGGKRGFLHVKLEGGKVSFKRLETSAPRFINVRSVEDFKQVKENDFVRVHISEEIPTVPLELPSENVEIVETPVTEEFEFELDNLSLMDTLEAWVDAKDPPNKEHVLKTGRELLAKAIKGAL